MGLFGGVPSCAACLVKIVVPSEALERATHSEADTLACMQPPSSKDGEALQKFS